MKPNYIPLTKNWFTQFCRSSITYHCKNHTKQNAINKELYLKLLNGSKIEIPKKLALHFIFFDKLTIHNKKIVPWQLENDSENLNCTGYFSAHAFASSHVRSISKKHSHRKVDSCFGLFNRQFINNTNKKSENFRPDSKNCDKKCWWPTLEALYNITNSSEHKQRAEYSRFKLAS